MTAITPHSCLVHGPMGCGKTTNATRPATGTLPTVYKMFGYEHLALSPNARRVHERYSL
ncbi:hypothetical protein EMIT048CA2_310046 [Pseudomonas chlororaphis]|uniref:hypothetical protein n=1 Tax=Pseudomonas chlororaphis TaxID=587753 RepID=UPI0039E19675